METKYKRGDMVKFYDYGLSQSGQIKSVRHQHGRVVYTIKCMGVSYEREESQISMV